MAYSMNQRNNKVIQGVVMIEGREGQFILLAVR